MSRITVARRWPGATVACVATGPSLTAADVDAVRGTCRVIVVNDAHRLAPWADCLYSSDRQWWRHYQGVPGFPGPKYGLGSAVGKRNAFVTLPDVQVLENTGAEGLECAPTGLRHGSNSGYAAINLAVHLGAARILLLGYTLGRLAPTRDDAAPACHFFGDHPAALGNPPDWVFPRWRRLFASLVAPLAELGIAVINCTPGTHLHVFPVRPLRAVLAEVAA